MEGLTRADRELFETAASDLYRETVDSAGIPLDDPRLGAKGTQQQALDLLLKLGLIIADSKLNAYVAVDPSAAHARIVSPLSQHGSALIEESARWADAFGPFALTWRRMDRPDRGDVVQLEGEPLQNFLEALVADAEFEMLTAHPQSGRDLSQLEVAIARDIAALDRGISMHTLYQHSARRNNVTAKYVAAVGDHGAEVRTLDEFFNRLIVVDRRIALVPEKENPRAAVVIREPSIVAYLTDMFERSWERARPFTNAETSTRSEIAEEQRVMTIRMLIEGHPDPTSAKRLGVSPRTYAGYIAELKTEYEAQTRFQLGYAMGARKSPNA
jgi:sugar-specific transcriptional regulator TrmB